MQKINYLFPFKQLRCIAKLGEGAFGTVFLVEDTETLKQFALKRCVKKQKYISREIQMLHMFKNKEFIVQIEAAFYTRDLRKNLISNILLELKPLTLYQLIYESKLKGQRLDEESLKKLLKPIVLGLQQMHNVNVAHRDLKPENILLDENLEATLGDIGSAKLLDPRKMHNPHICTLYYRAPELIWGSDSYTVQVDIWSLGCIIIELIQQKPLFYCTQEEHIFPAILHKLGGFNNKVRRYYQRNVIRIGSDMVWEIDKIFDEKQTTFQDMKQKGRISPILQDLLEKIFTYIPEERLTVAQVLAHPFFKQQEQRQGNKTSQGQSRQNNVNYGFLGKPKECLNKGKQANQGRVNNGQKSIFRKDSPIIGQFQQKEQINQYRFGRISSLGYLKNDQERIAERDQYQWYRQKQVQPQIDAPLIFQEEQQQIFVQQQVQNIFGLGEQGCQGERKQQIFPIFGQQIAQEKALGQGQLTNQDQQTVFMQGQVPFGQGQLFGQGQFQGQQQTVFGQGQGKWIIVELWIGIYIIRPDGLKLEYQQWEQLWILIQMIYQFRNYYQSSTKICESNQSHLQIYNYLNK
ncbi:hypothetical protein pb186bvf_015281 [Paramecium bursaria]